METLREEQRSRGEAAARTRAAEPGWLAAWSAMALRQLLRFRTAKSRLANSIVFPLMWLLFFGLGWSAAFNSLGPGARTLFGGLDYLKFLAPGIVVMSVFTAGFGSGLGLIWDREFGYFKEILVSPAPRSALLLGRITGDSVAALVQGAIMAVLVTAVAGWPGAAGLAAGIAAAFVAALASAGLGSLIALSMRSPEGFHMVVNLVMLPMLFISGAFYPIDPLPTWLKALAYLNPLYYAVDLARGLMYGVHSTPLLLDTLGLLAVTGASLAIAVARFSRTYIA
jgi:ABC-2 type transport system permease protein